MPTTSEAEHIVRDLVSYVKLGVMPLSIAHAVEVLGARRVRVLAMDLLFWFDRQRRWGRLIPLQLQADSRPHQELPILLSLCASLCELIELKDGYCRIREDVDVDTRERVLDIASSYNPPIFTLHPTA